MTTESRPSTASSLARLCSMQFHRTTSVRVQKLVAATGQHLTTCSVPAILLRLELNAGHSAGMSTEKRIQVAVDKVSTSRFSLHLETDELAPTVDLCRLCFGSEMGPIDVSTCLELKLHY